MIAAAAVVPSTPLLVPELGGRAADETAALRAASLDAASRLAEVASRWVAVGAGPASTHDPSARGSFVGFGVDVRVSLGAEGGVGAGPADPELPLPMLVAGWLRERAGAPVDVEGVVLDPATDAANARRCGASLADDGRRLGLLVVGDGAATHTARAPGAFDPRAQAYDAEVSRALAEGDAGALAHLDPALSDDLWVGGRVPWQVLAAAVPAPATARLTHSSAPYGVAYHVALWDVA